MNSKFIILIGFLTLFYSCKKNQEANSVEIIDEKPNQEVTEKEISNLNYVEFDLDIKTEKAVEDWQEYYQLQDVINNVKKGDLSFFYDNEESIKTLLKDIYKNIPAGVNSNATKVRLNALETKLHKLKSLSNLSTTSKDELHNVIKEFLESFSNLNFQMNKKLEKESQNVEKP